MPANSCFIFLYCLHLKQVWTKCPSCKSIKTNDSRSSFEVDPTLTLFIGWAYIHIPCHSNPQKDRTVSFPGCYFDEVSPIISRFPILVSFSVIGRVAMWQKIKELITVTPTLAWQKSGWLIRLVHGGPQNVYTLMVKILVPAPWSSHPSPQENADHCGRKKSSTSW